MALRKTKTVYNLGPSECNRVNKGDKKENSIVNSHENVTIDDKYCSLDLFDKGENTLISPILKDRTWVGGLVPNT